MIHRFAAPHFPSYPGPFSVFATLKNGHGVGIVALEINSLVGGGQLSHSQVAVTFADRLAEVNLHVRIQQCRFPAPGLYEFSLWVDEDIVAQRVVEAYQKGTGS
jgi:hypothetical protein